MQIWIRNVLYACVLAAFSPLLLVKTWKRRNQTAENGDSAHAARSSWRDKLLGVSLAQDAGDDSSSRIWLHGVSVGEVHLLRPLATKLLERNPQAKIFLSTTTRTGMQVARASFPSNVTLFYFPLDFSWAIRRTIRSIRPDLLVLGELEIWPNLMAICHKRAVPVVVVNGRLSDKSYRGYQRFSWLVKPVFANITQVCAQTEQYAERFVACGTPNDRVVVTGSMKFDNVKFDVLGMQAMAFRQMLGAAEDDRIIVAGSTQVEEETAILDAYAKLVERHPGLKLIVVPRHPERFDAAADLIQTSGLRWHRRSALSAEGSSPVASDWQVLLVDTLGELSSWWALAEIALVGGTFGARGGQNMIEPSAYGCNVVFGPRTENFRDVVSLLHASDAATQLSDTSELLDWLNEQLNTPQPGRTRGQNAIALVKSQQGAMDRTIEVLSHHAS
ncbi:MAG: 3-deoxy-D-manno-octulosonic acid transferase [Aureliella sp.]